MLSFLWIAVLFAHCQSLDFSPRSHEVWKIQLCWSDFILCFMKNPLVLVVRSHRLGCVHRCQFIQNFFCIDAQLVQYFVYMLFDNIPISENLIDGDRAEKFNDEMDFVLVCHCICPIGSIQCWYGLRWLYFLITGLKIFFGGGCTLFNLSCSCSKVSWRVILLTWFLPLS